MVTVSKNAPCPCGSGEKYKACCLEKAEIKAKASIRRRVLAAYIVTFAICAGLAAFLVYRAVRPGQYDDLAKCLTEKGFVVYGAYWCSNCDKQKDAFGKSFKHIDYVECSSGSGDALSDDCKSKGIKKIPTWITPNGRLVVGIRSPDQLAEESACDIQG